MTAYHSAKFIELQSTPGVSGVVLPVVFEIFSKWLFSLEEQMMILAISEEKTIHNWKAHPERVEMTSDLLLRISYILGIFKSLENLLPDQEIADNWLSKPNDNYLFNGMPPKSRLMLGAIEDLATVRDFLSYQESQ